MEKNQLIATTGNRSRAGVRQAMETGGSTVLALIDERQCSLASVRQAAELAQERRARLLVVPVKTGTSLFAQFCALFGAVPADDWDDHVFRRVAAILAPYRVSWEYQAAGPRSWPAADWLPAGGRALAIAARHDRGHAWFSRGDACRHLVVRRIAGDATPVLLVGCDRG